jgi:DMSO reductase family type II enzyme molybdopterin subunit
MAKKPDKGIGRRDFLKAASGVLASTSLFGCSSSGDSVPPPDSNEYVPKDLRDVSQTTLNEYRSQFVYSKGDSTGFSPHCVNCKGNCAWQTFEKDGRIVREEQVADYPQIRSDIPDANPRGCNKGAIHSQSLYEEDRLLYPMKQTGERGSGKWKRISWDEAFTEIAEKIVDKLTRKEFEKVMVYAGTGVLSPLKRGAGLRFGALIGAVRFNVAGPLGDMFPGATIAYGNSLSGTTSEAWYDADYLMIIGANPMVARMPDAHYINEGIYKGNRVVTVAPEYSPTARASSLWIPIKVGTDSLFIASMNHVILKEKLYNEKSIKELTDLPFLIKVKDKKLLKGSDMVPWGKKDVFYFYDLASSKPVEAPGSAGSDIKSIKLDKGIDPALEGTWVIESATGESIEVTTAFEILKKELTKFPPEATREHTGIHPDIVYKEARSFAKAKKSIIVGGYRTHKYFWGLLAMWGETLMLALTGHVGRNGALDIDNEWNFGDISALSAPAPARFGSGFLGDWFDMDYHKDFLTHYDDAEFKDTVGVSRQEVIRLAENAVEDKGFPYFGKPEIVIFVGDNKFPRSSAQKKSQDAFFKSVKFLVDVNFRISSSGHLADILLPATTAYEGWEIRMDPGYCRFANVMVPPKGLKLPGEVKSEWDIFMGLSKKISEIAGSKGITSVEDPGFKDPKNPDLPRKRNLHTLYDDFVNFGVLDKVLNEKDLFNWLYKGMTPVRHQPLNNMVEKGFITLNHEAGQTSPLYPDMPFYPYEPHVYLKKPYMTTSGRQQFYVDHDIYLRLGCQVPVGRAPIRPSKFPLAFFDAHTRYGIHTTWRTMKYHQRLQRGNPYICINPVTAKKKNIKDGDMVRVFNDIGEFRCMAKITGKIPPDSIWTEHAWEDIQFEGGKGYNNVLAPVISPLELVGKYGHLSFSSFWDGNRIMGESSVEIEKTGS